MRLVREFRVNSLVAVSQAFAASPGLIAGVTCSVLQANLTNTLQIKWGDVASFKTMSPLVVPAGFNGNGYVFGGPVAGEIFGFDWGPGADVYLGTIRFWDEPITPFGFAPLAVDFSSTLAAAATSAAVTANCMGAWLRGIQYVYQASQTSTPVAMLSDGTVPGGVFSSIGTGTLGVTIQASASQLALANSLTFKTTNNGAVNMTYFWRVMGLFGA